MHSVTITPITRRGKVIHTGAVSEPAVRLSHGGFSIYVRPQVEGFGYGLTITNKDGDTLFTIGDTQTPGVGD